MDSAAATIPADQDKGFAKAFSELFSLAQVKFCTNHRYENVKKNCSVDDSRVWLRMKNTPTAAKVAELANELSPRGRRYVDKIPYTQQFPSHGTNTHGRTTTNTVESDNNATMKNGMRNMDPVSAFKIGRDDVITKHNANLAFVGSRKYKLGASNGDPTKWHEKWVRKQADYVRTFTVEVQDGGISAKVRPASHRASYEEVSALRKGDDGYEEGEVNLHCTCETYMIDERLCPCSIAAAPSLGFEEINWECIHERDTKAAAVKQYDKLKPKKHITGSIFVVDINARLATFHLQRRGRKKQHKRKHGALESRRFHRASSSSSSQAQTQVQPHILL
jgi:hypothetical protein